jgi:hypothetical protein
MPEFGAGDDHLKFGKTIFTEYSAYDGEDGESVCSFDSIYDQLSIHEKEIEDGGISKIDTTQSFLCYSDLDSSRSSFSPENERAQLESLEECSEYAESSFTYSYTLNPSTLYN